MIMVSQSQIIEAIAKHLGVSTADIDLTASLSEDLGLGPIEVSDLLADLAKEFNVTINPTEVENLDTVADVVALVEDALLE